MKLKTYSEPGWHTYVTCPYDFTLLNYTLVPLLLLMSQFQLWLNAIRLNKAGMFHWQTIHCCFKKATDQLEVVARITLDDQDTLQKEQNEWMMEFGQVMIRKMVALLVWTANCCWSGLLEYDPTGGEWPGTWYGAQGWAGHHHYGGWINVSRVKHQRPPGACYT